MVKILVFVPHLDMKEEFSRIIEKYQYFRDIKIEMIYVFGTPASLSQNSDAEIYIARGMTCDRLRTLFPEKHIVEIQMTAFNILDALISAREKYHPKKIALCIHHKDISCKSYLEEVCGASIQIYDVYSEESALKLIERAQKEEIDVVVGAGTICGICDQKKIKRVHIRTLAPVIEASIVEAVNTAHTINRERTSHRVVRTILNNIEDAVICIDEKGIIQRINNQTYKIFTLPIVGEWVGENVDKIYSHFKWKEVIEEKKVYEEVIEFDRKSYYVEYKSIDIDGHTEAIVIRCKNAEQIQKEETRIRRSLGEKGLVAKYEFDDIIGKSGIMQSNIQMAKRYSQVHSNVLIIGETGTGKELFAHSIHTASPRRKEPFVALNCAALPENLLESELFGYETGAFSGASKNGKIGLFELAHKGTIFLDEIGEIPITLQAKLLRVLQEKEVMRIGGSSVKPIDVRVISATNINIEKQIEEGKFRSDLYYRLNLLDINIPPLRERKEDLQDMIDFYLTKFACEMKKFTPKLTIEAVNILTEYHWPGNVRELRNICERLMVLTDLEIITEEELLQLKVFRTNFKRESLYETLPNEVMSQLVPKKKKQDLAKELGVSRTTLWRMMKEQEIQEGKLKLKDN